MISKVVHGRLQQLESQSETPGMPSNRLHSPELQSLSESGMSLPGHGFPGPAQCSDLQLSTQARHMYIACCPPLVGVGPHFTTPFTGFEGFAQAYS